MQVGVGRGAHARWIAQTNVFSRGGQVEVELVAICQEAAQVQLASTTVRGEPIDLNAILREDHGAVDVAQSVGQVQKRNSRVTELDPAAGAGIPKIAGNVKSKLRRAIRQDVGIEALRQLEIEVPARVHVQSVVAGKLHSSLYKHVGIVAYQ